MEQNDKEINRQMSMTTGTKVRMMGIEGSLEKNKRVFEVTYGPIQMCGSLVVWLNGYSGCYSCRLLEIVEE